MNQTANTALSNGTVESAVITFHDNDNDGEDERHEVSDHHRPGPQHDSKREPKGHADSKGNVHP